MPNTRGNLAPATIENLITHEKVYCMFNPHEYTLSKQNQWKQDKVKGKNVPKVKFSQGGVQSLKLQLFFDTYADETDVREHTKALWKMMQITEQKKNPRSNKSEPPRVAFSLGELLFQGGDRQPISKVYAVQQGRHAATHDRRCCLPASRGPGRPCEPEPDVRRRPAIEDAHRAGE